MCQICVFIFLVDRAVKRNWTELLSGILNKYSNLYEFWKLAGVWIDSGKRKSLKIQIPTHGPKLRHCGPTSQAYGLLPGWPGPSSPLGWACPHQLESALWSRRLRAWHVMWHRRRQVVSERPSIGSSWRDLLRSCTPAGQGATDGGALERWRDVKGRAHWCRATFRRARRCGGWRWLWLCPWEQGGEDLLENSNGGEGAC
jgi:hypothetical protein